ncbi:MAG: TIR domain-containing protein, partial [Acidobacteriota bacterium]
MQVFISYSRKDGKWASRFEDALAPAAQGGTVTLWRDVHQAASTRWRPALAEALDAAQAGLLLVSQAFFTSTFIMQEELPVLLERHRRGAIKLFIVLLEDCLIEETELGEIQAAHDYATPLMRLDGDAQDAQILAIARQLVDAAKRTHLPRAGSQPPPADVRVEIDRLPQGTGTFVGRADELAQLDEMWNDAQVHVASLVAWGGVGKTALTQAWLARMAQKQYRGAKRVYAWSFYSQGTENRVASADDFLLKALAWFGEPDPASLSPSARPTRLAERVLAEPALLILDGL